ncbi:nucleolar pre-ribosomal-associated protein 1 [Paragonimus westermani]|uniref:Nucleolar pre-ribosomal-associated protein 1 n=1 Tax=Paragonimus westermani TaxID=34504 RepID=A0A5J4N913_9TREM|nr:nucleolar pre-ribosomal-associated protein 1 [Paragonimus westermani]
MPKRIASDCVEESVSKRPKFAIEVDLLGSDLTVLDQFVKLLDETDSSDLISQALSSKNILAILTFLDTGIQRKKTELLIIFRALYILVMRGMAYDSSSECNGIARELAEGVLEDCRFSCILRGLKNNLGAELNKAALRLLAAVATADVGIARGLLRSIHFDDAGLVQCSRRRNTTDPQDVRSCFLNLIGSFVFKDSNVLLRELIDKKNAFTLVSAESYIDKYANVILNIQMFRKIVENRSISKTQKVQLFNRNCLKHLLYLYTWRGEAVTLSELNSQNRLDANCDQLDSIRTSLHELMLLLFTSGRLGLVFSGRQRESNTPPNNLIFHALTSPAMEAAHMDVLRSQLVVASLTSCPDLIHLYLDHMAPLLQPRASSKNWLSLMNLVRQIFVACKTHLVGWSLATLERCTIAEQAASIIVNTCFLSAKMVDPIANALHYEEDPAVVKETKDLMKLLRTNILIILTWISTGDGFTVTTCNADHLKRELNQLLLDVVRYYIVCGFLVARTDADDTTKAVITRNPEQDRTELSSLPKEFRKPLKRLLGFRKTADVKCCPKLLSALNALPTVVEVCINSYFHLPVIHRCLANGLRAARHHSVPCVKPKRILQLLIQHMDFTTVLLCNNGTSDEASRDKDIAAANDLSNANTQWPFLRDYMVELLLEAAIVSPKACLKMIPVLWFLASYTATLNPTGEPLFGLLPKG